MPSTLETLVTTLSIPTAHGPAFIGITMIPEMIIPIEGGTKLCFGDRDVETTMSPEIAHKLFYHYDAKAQKIQQKLTLILPGYIATGYVSGHGRICVKAKRSTPDDTGHWVEVDEMLSIEYQVQINTKKNSLLIVKEPYEIEVHWHRGRIAHRAIPRMELDVDAGWFLKMKSITLHQLFGVIPNHPDWGLTRDYEVVGANAFDIVVGEAHHDRKDALAMKRAVIEYESRIRAAQLVKAGLVEVSGSIMMLARATAFSGMAQAEATKDASRRVATGRAFLPTD
jgi:hypothetical protein